MRDGDASFVVVMLGLLGLIIMLAATGVMNAVHDLDRDLQRLDASRPSNAGAA